MSKLTLTTRGDYIKFVEELYFGKVRIADHETVVGYFAPGAALIGYAGDAPARIMRKYPGPGEHSLDAFMKVAAHFDLTYLDFVHYVDVETERVASHFTLLMTPKPGGAMSHVPARRLKNCSFFRFEKGLLIEVVAYFSNPAASPPIGDQ